MDDRMDVRTRHGLRPPFLALILPAALWMSALFLACQQPAPPALPVIDAASLEPLIAGRIQQRLDRVTERPSSAEAWGRLGMVLDVHDMASEAVYCYEQAQELDEDDFRWPYLLGVLKRGSHPTESLAHFSRAAQLNDDYAPLHVYLGRAYLLNEQLEKASPAFRRALDLDPRMQRARIGLAKVALAEDSLETARELLEKALTQGVAKGEVHWLLAETFRRLGDGTAALAHFEQAEPLGPLEPMSDPLREELQWNEAMTFEWIQRRSDRLLRQGQPAEAIGQWLEALRESPQSPDLLTGLGRTYALSGQLAEAVSSYREALELDPSNIDAQVLLADALVEQQDVPQAIAAYEKALELDPSQAKARFKLGSLLLASGNDEGLGYLREALRSLEQNPEAHLYFARNLKSARRYREAVGAYRDGLEQFPDDPRLQGGFAWLLATCPDGQIRDGAAAIAWARKSADHALNLPALETLAAAYAEAGDFPAALRTATQAVELLLKNHRGDPSTLQHLEQRLNLYRAQLPYHEPQD